MTYASWLCVNGEEVANGNRAMSYMRTAGDPRWNVHLVADPVSEPDGPVPENLACFCASIEDPDRTDFEVTYVDPVTDDAPWYTPGVPESAEFLGVHLIRAELTAPYSRAVSPTGSLGSVVGPLRRGHRILQVRAWIFASTDAGMAFGQRWLTAVLGGSACSDDTVSMLAHCCEPGGGGEL